MSPENRFRTREIALSGKLRTADDPATIGPNDLSVCKNMRPSEQYPRGIGGMTKINTTPITSSIRAGVHLSKSQPSESHVVVADASGRLFKNDTAIPAQGNFGVTPLFTGSAGYQSPRLAVVPQGAMALCNGVDSVIYGGDEFRCAGFMDNPVAGSLYDYSDQVASADADTYATIHTTGSGPWIATFYVGSVMPISAFKLYMLAANNKASTMGVKYYDGDSWEAVSTLSDGTTSGGISLAQDGTVSFDSTASVAKIYSLNSIFLYWYQVTVTAAGADFNGIPKVEYATVTLPAQKIRDIWDGESKPVNSALIYVSSADIRDYTTNVTFDAYDNADPSSYMPMDPIDSSSNSIMLGFIEPMMGVIFNCGEENFNSVVAAMTVKYWSGSAWTAVTGLVDGTVDDGGTKSLNRSGTVFWTAPADGLESRKVQLPAHNIGNLNESLYYYQFTFSAGLTNEGLLYFLRGIPAQKSVKGHSFPLEHQGRTVLCDEYHGDRNSILMSAQDTLNVFNGLDSYKFSFGNDSPFVAGTSLFLRFGSSVQDMLLLCKKGQIWLLEGNGSDSDPFRIRLLSATIGCRATMTMATIPVGDLGGGVRRQIAVFESQRGIEVFDGAALMDPMLSHDIRDKFDPNSSTFAGSSANAGFYDPVYDEYHWCPVGTAEWVFSFKYKKWYQPVRGTGKYLYGGFPVMDTSGNSYIYGFDNDGYVYRLENGTDFDGNAIVHTLKTGAVALNENRISEETSLRMVKVVQVAKNTTSNTMTVTHFGDTDTGGNALGSISPAASGKRLRSGILNAGSKGPHVHHEFQLSITTTNETCGCEPIYIVAYYDGERQDVR